MTRRHDRQWLILAVLCVGVLIVVIDNTIVNVALPTLSVKLSASNSGLQWIVDSYSLPFAGFLLAGGELSDRWGRRRVMQSALLAFAAVSVWAAQSHSMTQLLTARAMMGVCAGFIFPATLSLVTTTFNDLAQRAKAFGIWGATAGVAIAIGPISGGYLIDHYWYGSVFMVNVPVALITIVLVALWVPESRSPVARRIDLAGVVVGGTAVSSLVLALIEGPSWGWLSVKVLGFFVLSLVTLVLFVRYECRLETPMLDMRLFRRGTFSSSAVAVGTSFFCLFGFVFLVTQYFQLVRGYSPLSAGVHTLPFAVTTMVVTPLGAMLALRTGTRVVVTAGLFIMGASLAWMTQFDAFAPYWGPVIISMVLLSVGFSLISSPSTSAVMSSLSSAHVGAGAAVNEVTRELGGTLGVAVVGSVFSSLFSQRITALLAPLHVAPHDLHLARSSMQGALRVASVVGSGSASATLHPALVAAFMGGFHRACAVASLTAIAAGLVCCVFLPGRQLTPGSDARRAQSCDYS